jgi:hypothetical protein
MLHEHAAALSAASPANRSRRLIKCAKESARYPSLSHQSGFAAAPWIMGPRQSRELQACRPTGGFACCANRTRFEEEGRPVFFERPRIWTARAAAI